MLRSLHMKDVGPAPRFELELGERLNVLTGDNGLGKSFVLDVAWWALTGTWVDRAVLPREGGEGSAELSGQIVSAERSADTFRSPFRRVRQDWKPDYHDHRKMMFGGLGPDAHMSDWLKEQAPVLYVGEDGAISVWDPTRNHHRQGPVSIDQTENFVVSSNAYHFSTKTLWDGLELDGKPICNGLIRDWVTWQLEAGADASHPFHLLCRVLEQLSHPTEKMKPGKPVKLYLDDVRKFPTVLLPYGTVPVIHASAGMRRILGLSYLIAWAWTEHVDSAKLLGWKPAERLVVLMEEPETHLHPNWQRHIVPALVNVLSGLAPGIKPQLLLTTHSPLVLASLEPLFKSDTDKIFKFELHDREVVLEDLPWTKYGDAEGWLTSDIFDLKAGRSIESERAIEAAYAYMRGDLARLPDNLKTKEAIHQELVRVLPDQDPFWPQWIIEQRRRHE